MATLHRFEMASRRRGKPFETTGLMCHSEPRGRRRHLWTAVNQYVLWANESAADIGNILQADANIWHLRSEECIGGTQSINGIKPLEHALAPALKRYGVDTF